MVRIWKKIEKGKTNAENRNILMIPLILSLIVLPLSSYGQAQTSRYSSAPSADLMNASTPPVGQPLVPEGVFAVQLAQELKIGKVQDEARAESMLSAIGIEPKNGWIAGYPMTPDIVAEIQTSVAAAAEAKKLEIHGQGSHESLIRGLGVSYLSKTLGLGYLRGKILILGESSLMIS